MFGCSAASAGVAIPERDAATPRHAAQPRTTAQRIVAQPGNGAESRKTVPTEFVRQTGRMLHENVMKAFPVYRRNVNRCCVTIGQVMKEHELILRVLRDLSRRLWLARAIREAVFAVCVILFSLVCLELVQPAFVSQSPSSGASLRMACLTVFAVVVSEIVWKIARMVTTEQAAADADGHVAVRAVASTARGPHRCGT